MVDARMMGPPPRPVLLLPLGLTRERAVLSTTFSGPLRGAVWGQRSRHLIEAREGELPVPDGLRRPGEHRRAGHLAHQHPADHGRVDAEGVTDAHEREGPLRVVALEPPRGVVVARAADAALRPDVDEVAVDRVLQDGEHEAALGLPEG